MIRNEDIRRVFVMQIVIRRDIDLFTRGVLGSKPPYSSQPSREHGRVTAVAAKHSAGIIAEFTPCPRSTIDAIIYTFLCIHLDASVPGSEDANKEHT